MMRRCGTTQRMGILSPNRIDIPAMIPPWSFVYLVFGSCHPCEVKHTTETTTTHYCNTLLQCNMATHHCNKTETWPQGETHWVGSDLIRMNKLMHEIPSHICQVAHERIMPHTERVKSHISARRLPGMRQVSQDFVTFSVLGRRLYV